MKKFTTYILTIAIILTTLITPVFSASEIATAEDLTIDDQPVFYYTETGEILTGGAFLSGTIKYTTEDGITKLEFQNVTISTTASDRSGLRYTGTDDVYIKLQGENYIYSDDPGIVVDSNLTIEGSKLNIHSDLRGIICSCDITIQNAELTVITDNECAINSDNLYIQKSDVYLSGTPEAVIADTEIVCTEVTAKGSADQAADIATATDLVYIIYDEDFWECSFYMEPSTAAALAQTVITVADEEPPYIPPVYYDDYDDYDYEPEHDKKCPRDETCPMAKYNDLDPLKDYHDGIHFCLEEDYMHSTVEDEYWFSPDMDTTRTMVMTIIARIDGIDTSTGEKWYTVGEKWAVEQGISDGTNPENSITIEQLATMLYRYASKKGQTPANEDEALSWCMQNGIFQPAQTAENHILRSDMAEVVRRYCEILY